MQHRYGARFSIRGDLRFISHQDCARLFERAMVRAHLPLKYSEGFNPRGRISLPLPRSVGVAAEQDVVVFDLCEQVPQTTIADRLSACLPEGITLQDVFPLPAGRGIQPVAATYRLPLPAKTEAGIRAAAAELLARDSLVVRREPTRRSGARDVDLRPFLRAVRAAPQSVEIDVVITPQGTIRPAEILHLLGLAPREHLHRLVRVRVEWDPPLPPASPVGTPDALPPSSPERRTVSLDATDKEPDD